MFFVFLLLYPFLVTQSLHTYNYRLSEPEVTSYTCFEKDSYPVDTDQVFEDSCLDKHGNKYKSESILTSCCQCLM